ncbi:response regulator [Oligoflexia bacterium]|nr:response regulator [Oligoflexia bacterium]
MENIEILLCQAELTAALDLEQKLEECGYQVTAIATTGRDALNLAEELQPDLAFIDLMLRDEFCGVEIASILGRRLSIPSIYLIDRSDIEKENGAHLLDAVGYLIKPVEAHDLRACIELGLSVHRKHEKLVSNLDWHRIQLDASLACTNDLRAEATSAKNRLLALECSSRVAKQDSEQVRQKVASA